MRKLHVLICLGVFLAFAAQSNAGLVNHISGVGNNTTNGTNLVAAITRTLAAYPTTDTLMIDDSATYAIPTTDIAGSSAKFIMNKPIKIVAASGQTPVLYWNYASADWLFRFDVGGCQVGSSAPGEDGRITIDLAGKLARIIGFNISGNWIANNNNPTTSTLENLVITGQGTYYSQGYMYQICIGGWAGGPTGSFPVGTTINLKNIDIVFNNLRIATGTPPVLKTDGGVGTNDWYAIGATPENGAVVNIENVRSNGLRGRLVMVGSKASNYAEAYGTVNLKNCSLWNDHMTTHPHIGAVVEVQGWGGLCPGFDVNIDNCFLRNDASNNAWLNSTFVRATDTSNSLGCIALLSNMKNNVTITNSAMISRGSGLYIDTTQSLVRMTNCDVYTSGSVTVSDGGAGVVTPGYFVNMSRRIAAIGDHQTTLTRCNLFGTAGSELANDLKKSTDRFVMVSCNDWSPTNAYAAGWIKTSCVEPGRNPGYGAPNGEIDNPGIAQKDFTVYSQYIKGLNIGSDRAFNMGVPVEMSTFQVR